ncbi:hypothetical protein OK308_07285 [Streptococcus pneumoniae]|nr:hypothetical protein [Streptococcus pneumoniae]
MEVVSSVLNWFSSNILQNPAFFVGLLVLIGYALLKKPAHDVFSGFVKATVGYMLLNVGAGGLVTTFRPILAALNYKFQIGAAVIDPYFGLVLQTYFLNNPFKIIAEREAVVQAQKDLENRKRKAKKKAQKTK